MSLRLSSVQPEVNTQFVRTANLVLLHGELCSFTSSFFARDPRAKGACCGSSVQPPAVTGTEGGDLIGLLSAASLLTHAKLLVKLIPIHALAVSRIQMPCVHQLMTWVVSLVQWIGTSSVIVSPRSSSPRFLPDLLHLQMASPECFSLSPYCPTPIFLCRRPDDY
jgi:hypothetical protein